MKKLVLSLLTAGLLATSAYAELHLANDKPSATPSGLELLGLESDDAIHPEVLARTGAIWDKRQTLAIPDLTKPQRSQSGLNTAAQTKELTDTIIQMSGGKEFVDSGLYGVLFFAIALNQSLTLDQQKCLNDKLNYPDYYQFLTTQSADYIKIKGNKAVAEDLKLLIDSGTAKYSQALAIAFSKDSDDSGNGQYSKALFDKVQTDTKLKAAFEKLVEKRDNDQAFVHLISSIERFTDNAAKQCSVRVIVP